MTELKYRILGSVWQAGYVAYGADSSVADSANRAVSRDVSRSVEGAVEWVGEGTAPQDADIIPWLTGEDDR